MAKDKKDKKKEEVTENPLLKAKSEKKSPEVDKKKQSMEADAKKWQEEAEKRDKYLKAKKEGGNINPLHGSPKAKKYTQATIEQRDTRRQKQKELGERISKYDDRGLESELRKHDLNIVQLENFFMAIQNGDLKTVQDILKNASPIQTQGLLTIKLDCSYLTNSNIGAQPYGSAVTAAQDYEFTQRSLGGEKQEERTKILEYLRKLSSSAEITAQRTKMKERSFEAALGGALSLPQEIASKIGFFFKEDEINKNAKSVKQLNKQANENFKQETNVHQEKLKEMVKEQKEDLDTQITPKKK